LYAPIYNKYTSKEKPEGSAVNYIKVDRYTECGIRIVRVNKKLTRHPAFFRVEIV